jgi:hypothetical protein
MTKSRGEPPKTPAQLPARLDPKVIDAAPVDPDVVPVQINDDLFGEFRDMVGDLALQLDEANAEIERLRGQKTVAQVKAAMLEPYSKGVFWFVVGYCVVVAILLVLAGWGAVTGFHLSDAILGIIAGSTAVSVIGLIGMVITGLFASER